MSSKIRNVALLLPAVVLLTGLASAQSISVTSRNDDGTTATTTLDSSNGGPAARTPAAGRYWDSLASTNYYNVPPYIAAPPNPSIAVGPDDIFVIVNRTIARYPNPNAGGAGQGIQVPNPYNNPPTEQVFVDNWLGIQNLNGPGGLCPSGTTNNATCVLDNVSIRYDQMQGRFVVVMTVTDLPAHRSNFVVIVSRFSQFTKCSSTTPAPPTCTVTQPGGSSSPLFSPPVIAPIVGGTQTGGTSDQWALYKFPINLAYLTDAAGTSTETAIGFGRVSTPVTTLSTGGQTVNFLTTPFCTNGGPAVNASGVVVNGPPPAVARTCTNYFPTGARMGFDNDNLILTAPVLDLSYGGQVGGFPGTVPEGTLPFSSQQIMGPYAGTRVVTVPKLLLYNFNPFSSLAQPPACTTANPVNCQAVNLADNVYTGTLTNATYAPVAGGLVTTSVNGPNGLTGCALATAPVAIAANILGGGCASTSTSGVVLPGIFWEPDNLRGRALASFDAQVAPFTSLTAGVITPFDYLVGTRITDNFGGGFRGDFATRYFLQPIIFSCPGQAIFPGPSGVAFCGGTSATQTPDIPVLGVIRDDAFSQLQISDPAPVGQGFSATDLRTNPSNNPISSTATSRLFVGDSRPQQVMFREGLLYVARTVRTYDQNFQTFNPLNSSTVLYELLKTCATTTPVIAPNGNSQPTCGATFSAAGGNVSGARSAMSGIWTYAANVGDPIGNPGGFGFYQPMFESPADVVNALTGGPTPPINTFPWLENVFVGMTTGGTSNLAAAFSKNFPSLWDFRPGDDAFDTNLPYIDPYTGIVYTTVPCPGSLTVLASVVNGSANITVQNATGLQVGMFTTSTNVATFPARITAIVPNGTGGAVVTLSSNYTGTTNTATSLTFSLDAPGVSFTITQIVNGSNQVTVSSVANLQIGNLFAATGTQNATATITNPTQLNLTSTTNVGVGEVVTGRSATVSSSTVAGSTTVIVPATAQIAVGQVVTGTGIPAGPPATTVAAIGPNGADTTTLQVTLSAAATATGTGVSLSFSSAGLFTAGTLVSAPPAINGTTNIFPAAASTTGTSGVPVTFTARYAGAAGSNTFFATTPRIVNILPGNILVLDQPAIVTDAQFPNVAADPRNPLSPAPPAGAPASAVQSHFPTCVTPDAPPATTTSSPKPCASNLPASVVTSDAATLCPMIPFSQRGGASTDPNDGSLWLYGEFAKNRFAGIPGPGQWGTAVANYPLNLMATDTYYNDNTFFQDVQPGSTFFTWIQIAKNVGLAQPAATGPCNINNGGNPPILQPPAPGQPPTPGTGTLICPYFIKPGDTGVVTRAEMAYWVVRSQMDDQMVANYLCATGGDPTGKTVCPGVSGGGTSSTFTDTSGIVNPFLSVPVLGFPGVTNDQLLQYIEVMARRGYTKGCGSTNDPLSRYCPNDPVKRQEMAVFLIRAKMNNVFPTRLSGTPSSTIYGDNFGLFQQSPSYFSDVPTTSDYYIYIQKMRELRITNGTSGSTFSPTANLTRPEIATFVIRAFFL